MICPIELWKLLVIAFCVVLVVGASMALGHHQGCGEAVELHRAAVQIHERCTEKLEMLNRQIHDGKELLQELKAAHAKRFSNSNSQLHPLHSHGQRNQY